MARVAVSQQRKDLRIPFQANVQFSMDQFNWHLGRSQNISKRGIFVETGKMPKLGTRIYLNFKIFVKNYLSPKMAVPIRTAVDPSSIATSKSPDIPIESSFKALSPLFSTRILSLNFLSAVK